MKIAVCDDYSLDRQALCLMLRQYFSARLTELVIEEYESGEAFLRAFPDSNFDLIFLDVYMGGMTGTKTAKAIRAQDKTVSLIFTTTSKEHGADAFDVDAFHYLLKPVSREKLYSVLDKWTLQRSESRTLELKNGKTGYSLSVADIIYAEVLGRTCTIHTAHNAIEATISLATLEDELPQGSFCRPIRYCLVSLRHIESIGESTLTLTNGDTVPLSRRERDKVKGQFADYRLSLLRRR